MNSDNYRLLKTALFKWIVSGSVVARTFVTDYCVWWNIWLLLLLLTEGVHSDIAIKKQGYGTLVI